MENKIKRLIRLAGGVALGTPVFFALVIFAGRFSPLIIGLLIALFVSAREETRASSVGLTLLILLSGALGGRAIVLHYRLSELMGNRFLGSGAMYGYYYIYRVLGKLAGENPLVFPANRTVWLGALFSMLAVGGLGAFAVNVLKKRKVLTERLVFLSIALLLGVLFLYATISPTAGLRAVLRIEPANENYGYDAHIFLKTYYLMGHGKGYYTAIVDAALGDARVKTLDGWLPNPVLVRQPALFYAWRILAPRGDIIFFASLLLALVALWSVYGGVEKRAGPVYAILAVAFVMPYMITSASWLNILFPDWWGSLLALAAFGLMLRGRYRAAAPVALLAALTRETMALVILAGLIGTLSVRDWKATRVFVGAAFLFAVFYFAHYSMAAAALAGKVSYQGVSNLYSGVHLKALQDAVNFQNVLLGGPQALGLITLGFGLVGAVSIPDRASRVAFLIFLGGFILYMLFMKTSSYWGQVIIMPSLVAAPFFFHRLAGWLRTPRNEEPIEAA